MYEEYWRLQEKPFENTPDPKFIYYSTKHEEALSRMLYSIRERKGAARSERPQNAPSPPTSIASR